MMPDVSYSAATTSRVLFGDRVEAFFALPPTGDGPFPAVVLGHERYGLVRHTLDLAAKFAADGYVCVAPDMFSRWVGDKAALNRGDIQVPLSDDDIISYMSESVDFLLSHPKVDSSRIVAMGVCQSGSYPLLLNSVRKEVTANIVVYGGAHQAEYTAGPPRRVEPYMNILSRISAPVLGLWGEDDFVVSIDDVRRLRGILEDHRKTYEFVLFRDMPHGWMNDTMPGRYRPRETAMAWKLILDFISRVHAGAFPPDRMIWRFESDAAVSYDFTKKVRLA
jgi:carboxymethylenebutenolidase